MDCRRALFAVIVTGGCTKPNPDFDENESGETRAADDKDDASAESEVGNLDDTDTATSLGTVDSSDGPVECAEMLEFDWTVEVRAGGAPFEIPCDVPFALQGTVTESAEDSLFIVDCNGTCGCTSAADPFEVRSPELLAPLFEPNACVRVEIEWSMVETCRPVGFVLFLLIDDVPVPFVMAGQDVATLPQAVGGAAIGFSTISPCECPECCDESGIAALDFLGVQIPEGIVGHILNLLGDDVLWEVEVFEAHVHDDCSPALSWWGFPD